MAFPKNEDFLPWLSPISLGAAFLQTTPSPNDSPLRKIWDQPPKVGVSTSGCSVKGKDVVRYPTGENFNLLQVLEKYSYMKLDVDDELKLLDQVGGKNDVNSQGWGAAFSESEGQDGINSPGWGTSFESRGQDVDVISSQSWGTPYSTSGGQEVINLQSFGTASSEDPESPKTWSAESFPTRKSGNNKEDADTFARRYGVEDGPKPILNYRMRKGKYRKEF